MSRAYKIKVKESVTQKIEGKDSLTTNLDLLELLPAEEMADILCRELKDAGFEEQPDGTYLRTKEDLSVQVNPCDGEVEVSVKQSATTSVEVIKEGLGFDDLLAKEQQIKDKLREQALELGQQQINKQQDKMQSDVSKKLEKAAEELQPEIRKIVNKVTREALKIKAKRLGTVTRTSENEKTGELTLEVELAN